MNRRRFLEATAAATPLAAAAAPAVDRPALLGGTPIKLEGTRKWPVFDQREEQVLLGVLRSGKWNRGNGEKVPRFEAAYAKLTGAKHCLAVANGTSALLTALSALDVGPGDEVILPPYTFVATLNVILEKNALPVFVDSDRETFQMDAKRVSAAITERTRAILPVHMAGGAADLDTILSAAKAKGVPVIEDACQAHLGEWRGRKVGTWGAMGCFSFQASKNLNSGEGGAVLSNDDTLAARCAMFHNNGRSPRKVDAGFSYAGQGLNLRLTEFQGAILMAQMERLEAQSRTRETNAAYLAKMLGEIPGIAPVRNYEGCTRSAWHLYMFRYDKERFGGLPRAKFLKAMAAEGIPVSAGYSPLNKEPLLQTAFATRGFQRVYPTADLRGWADRNACPENDRLCEEACWLTQTTLLGPRTDMERIAAAIRKVQRHAGALLA